MRKADWRSSSIRFPPHLQASAAFVSASALGMAAGPAMAGLMTSLNIHVPFLPGRPIVVNDVTAPGWIMTIWWLLFLVGVMVFFKVRLRSIFQYIQRRIRCAPEV
jgi:hypothetical protein